MIKYSLKSLFEQDSVPKQLNITFLNDSSRTYSNEDISSEQCTLTESLCSQEALKFGACEASSVKFTIMNDNKSWQNAEIKLELILNNDTSNPFTIGTFYVNEDVPSSDRANREITAYDKMYTLLTRDVTNWYTEFWENKESCTIREFRDALCSYLGVQQENVSLINDSVSIPKSVEDEVVTVQNLFEDLGEFNACFPHFNRNNQLTYIYIQDPETGLYPGATTFPGNDVYPNTPSNPQHTEIFNTTKYIDFQYSDFDILKCTGVCFKKSETDSGVISKNSDDNIYTITNNIFARALTTDTLVNVAKNIFDKLQKITYTPVTQLTKLHSNLCTEVGDNVIINTKDKKIATILLERTATGIQGISDAYISKGSLKYPDVNSDNTLASAVEKLKNSTHTLINDAKQLKSEISDKVSTSVFDQTSEYINAQVTRLDANDTALSGRITVTADAVNTEVTRAKGTEESLSGRINVTAGEITQEVSRATSEENTLRASISLKIDKDDDGQIISMINESADVITLNSNRLIVNSTNFTLDRNGNVRMKGKVEATSGSVGPFNITNSGLEWASGGTKIWSNVIFTDFIEAQGASKRLVIGSESITNRGKVDINSSDGGVWINNAYFNPRDAIELNSDKIKVVYSSSGNVKIENCNGFISEGSSGYGNLATVGYVKSKVSSDERIKKNIIDIPNVKDVYMDIPVYQFEYNGILERDGICFGTTAQGIERAFEKHKLDIDKYNIVQKRQPSVFNGEYKYIPTGDDLHYINWENINGMSVYMIQELVKNLETLKQEIEDLKSKLGGN